MSTCHTTSKETVKKCGLDDPLFGQLLGWTGQEGRDVYLFFFFFLPHHTPYSMQNFSSQGLNPCPLQWKPGVLTSRPLGKSEENVSLLFNFLQVSTGLSQALCRPQIISTLIFFLAPGHPPTDIPFQSKQTLWNHGGLVSSCHLLFRCWA